MRVVQGQWGVHLESNQEIGSTYRNLESQSQWGNLANILQNQRYFTKSLSPLRCSKQILWIKWETRLFRILLSSDSLDNRTVPFTVFHALLCPNYSLVVCYQVSALRPWWGFDSCLRWTYFLCQSLQKVSRSLWKWNFGENEQRLNFS